MRIVLDTNGLVASLGATSPYRDIWLGFHDGKKNPFYRWNLITADLDDNKFVDCAIAANATFIVSDDKHFCPLQFVDFPRISVVRLMEFVEMLRSTKE